MKIGLISDTHDDLEAMEKGLRILSEKKVDLIIHCGDWTHPEMVKSFQNYLKSKGIPGKAVAGNNDKELKIELANGGRKKYEELFSIKDVLVLDLEGRRIAVYHGENKTILRKLWQSQEYDAVFFGHTHIPISGKEEKTIIVNPGSASPKIARSKHIYSSVAIYDTSENEAEIYDTVP